MTSVPPAAARLAAPFTLSVLLSCAPPVDAPSPTPRDALPVDTGRIHLDEAQRWTHRRAVDADLDADGIPERITLVSDVQTGPGGVPLWEDGHRWAVIVEDGEAHMLLYGAFVPNGAAEAAVLAPEATNRRHVLVRERTPQSSRNFVIAYEGPGTARTVSAADNHVEQWIPSLTQ